MMFGLKSKHSLYSLFGKTNNYLLILNIFLCMLLLNLCNICYPQKGLLGLSNPLHNKFMKISYVLLAVIMPSLSEYMVI